MFLSRLFPVPFLGSQKLKLFAWSLINPFVIGLLESFVAKFATSEI